MVHLRMSGQLLVAPAGSSRPPHAHVVLGLAGEPAEELRFVDPRTFGEMVVYDPDRVAEQLPEVARLGVDPLVDDLDRATLARLLTSRRRQLKALLLDQHVIAGIGNIYADEILHAAGLRPDRRADTLRPAQIARLHDAMSSVLGAAVAAGGSSLRDAQYVDLMGAGGGYQAFHQVVERAGEPCRRCGRARIRRGVVAGRTTVWCPRCQR
jgi:formamidopyrimidine-DNA glycosylase